MLIHHDHSVAGSRRANPNENNVDEDYELLREKINDEKYAIYSQQLNASQGFDVDTISISDMTGEIFQLMRVGGEPDHELKNIVDFAIEQQNKNEGSHLQLVKIIKANCACVAGEMYYVTLDAKDGEDNIDTYEAQVYDGIQERDLMLFRQSKTPSGSSSSSSSSSSD
ncbi:uncharacterized protein LOC126681862 [Mercurialis annua]|uniref:uncharacterized protein LOC126681862 n=1 Tax=Mercurialis annua TaxID=3986 RepID=UPI00215FC7EA|nr:uncharacterized protein LOC126681862 [Mercurialis annua]